MSVYSALNPNIIDMNKKFVLRQIRALHLKIKKNMQDYWKKYNCTITKLIFFPQIWPMH